MRILTVVGARPQFIKASAVSAALRGMHEEILVHTGQHHDAAMSDVFFAELGLAAPDHHLGISGGTHGAMVGRMLEPLERVLRDEVPDLVLVYGDTNSTLAGGLIAAQLGLRLAHVEAGLRSFDRRMPEEINRVLVDHLAQLLLCPSETAVSHLAAEGISEGVHLVGDVMADVLRSAPTDDTRSRELLAALEVSRGHFVLATAHRAANTDDPVRLRGIVEGLSALDEPVVWPMHPRTRNALSSARLVPASNVRVIPPASYFDMVRLCRASRAIVTDSGGLQKEAYWLGIPCVTVREETEWTETVTHGWNRLTSPSREAIVAAVSLATPAATHPVLYGGDGGAAQRIVAVLGTLAPALHTRAASTGVPTSSALRRPPRTDVLE